MEEDELASEAEAEDVRLFQVLNCVSLTIFLIQ